MKKQTAVEYLIQYMMNNQYFIGNDLADVFDQAKAMEKQQIIDAYGKERVCINHDGCTYMINAEQYYTETYGK